MVQKFKSSKNFEQRFCSSKSQKEDFEKRLKINVIIAINEVTRILEQTLDELTFYIEPISFYDVVISNQSND